MKWYELNDKNKTNNFYKTYTLSGLWFVLPQIACVEVIFVAVSGLKQICDRPSSAPRGCPSPPPRVGGGEGGRALGVWAGRRVCRSHSREKQRVVAASSGCVVCFLTTLACGFSRVIRVCFSSRGCGSDEFCCGEASPRRPERSSWKHRESRKYTTVGHRTRYSPALTGSVHKSDRVWTGSHSAAVCVRVFSVGSVGPVDSAGKSHSWITYSQKPFTSCTPAFLSFSYWFEVIIG